MNTILKIRNTLQRLYGWYFSPMAAIIVWDSKAGVWFLSHDGREVPGHRYYNINDTVNSAKADGWRLRTFT